MTMMDEQQQGPRVYSDEEIRHAVNADSPIDAMEIMVSLFQRMTLALESMAQSMTEPPTVLFEQANGPLSDGLGLTDVARRDDDQSH